ncbi:MAG TPA: acetate kinase, partial [Humibacillus xanthopallidus]|nr:acetate kinase [Humibacillus xanthopallidus]
YLAHLGRVDAIVFTAGVGQNSARVRAALADGLEGLGIRVDPERNETDGGCFSSAAVISPEASSVVVAVVPTNEELAIARQTADLVR